MHYTALQNYSVSAASPPAQKAPVMAAMYSISAASGELMIPENAGVVIQAKSGINAIRVSGTATTTSGMTGPGTTANQIQFYSNDTIVGAFDRLGLCTNSIQIGTSNHFLISKGAGSLLGNIVIGDPTSGGNLTGTGTNNVIIGANNAGSKITTGSANVAIGWGSMGNGVTTGNINTCVGPTSGFNLTSGNLNTLIGQNAGGNMTSGFRNIGLGAGALGYAEHTGSNNIGIGVDAGSTITTGYDNICIGRASTISAPGNNNEIVIGAGMIGNGSNTTTIANRVHTGGLSVASASVYPFSLTRTNADTGASYGTTIEFRVNAPNNFKYAQIMGGVLASSAENTRGWISLDVNNSGNFAGTPSQALIYGDVNNGVIINNRLNLNAALLANSSVEMRTGNIMYFNNPANSYSWSFKTDSSNIFHMVNQFGTDYLQLRDDMGVVTTLPFRSYSAGTVGSTGYIGTGNMGGGCPSLIITDAGGSNHFRTYATIQPGYYNYNINYSVTNKNLIANLSTGTWAFDSDFNLKTNIISLSSSLQNILNLKPVTFNYKTDPNDPPIAGFIAQDVQPYFPRLVSRNILPDGTENPYLSLSQTGLIPYLVKAIQEQHEEIMNLKFIVSKLVK